MGAFDNVALTPCPPVIDDHEAIVGGEPGNPCTPVEATINTIYRADYYPVSGGLVFKMNLVAGRKYRIIVYGSNTLADLQDDHAALYLWNPTDWPGETDVPFDTTYYDIADEDSGAQWCPWEEKLNVLYGGSWRGGRRYEFTATESGYWVVMFKAWENPS